MRVLEKKRPSYKAAPGQPAPPLHESHQFPAPIRGWVTNESKALSQPGGALIFENGFPTQTGAEVRDGSRRKAIIGGTAVESFLSYVSGSQKTLFAASDGKIFDVTNPARPDVAPAPAVSGQTSNNYSFVQFATVGGEFMVAVNGTDLHYVFDGTAWAQNTPAITGVASSALSQLWVYRNRIFFVEKNTRSAWYLPVDSIGGAAVEFPLNGVFQKGGSLLFGATWSLDAGDGLDDKCVFVSTTGEVVVFQGIDPSSAATWSEVGRYDMPAPKGQKAIMRAGGNLLIGTINGLIPISEGVTKDPGALSLAAISRPIEPDWKRDAVKYASRPWEIAKWDEKNRAIVIMPSQVVETTAASEWGSAIWGNSIWGGGAVSVLEPSAQAYVLNLETGRWAKYTGWDAQCIIVHGGACYFGTSDGRIMEAEVGGDDDGKTYYFRYGGLFEAVIPNVEKQVLLARPKFTSTRDFKYTVDVAVNDIMTFPALPTVLDVGGESGVWDDAVWDEDVWDAGTTEYLKDFWSSIGKAGYSIAPTIQIAVNSPVSSRIELTAVDITYGTGAIVA